MLTLADIFCARYIGPYMVCHKLHVFLFLKLNTYREKRDFHVLFIGLYQSMFYFSSKILHASYQVSRSFSEPTNLKVGVYYMQ